MRKENIKKVFIFFLTSVCFLLFWIGEGRAGDFASSFQTAIKSYPPATNIAGMGGIWAALPSPYSANPAAFPRIKDYDLKNAAYGSYNFINFLQGPDIKLWSGTGLSYLGPGVLRVDYYDFDSQRTKSKNGFETDIEGQSLQIGYGLPITKKLSIGATLLPVYSSKASFHSTGMLVAEGRSEIDFGGRVGLLYNPLEKLFLSLVYEYNKNELKNTIFNPLTLGYIKTTEHPITHLIRPGIAIQPWKGGTIGIDYLWGRIDNKKGKDDYKIDQWFLGAEQWLTSYLALRTGLANGSFTGGLGLKWKNFLLDYAYIARSMKDMNSYFDRSSSHLISLTIAW